MEPLAQLHKVSVGFPKVYLLPICILNKSLVADIAFLQAGDGVFATTQAGYISLVDLKSNKTTNLVATSDVLDVSSSSPKGRDIC